MEEWWRTRILSSPPKTLKDLQREHETIADKLSYPEGREDVPKQRNVLKMG